MAIEWANRILTASIQGGIALTVALLIVWLLPSRMAKMKIWVLRVAFVKLLLAGILVGGVALSLPRAEVPPHTAYGPAIGILAQIALAMWVACILAAIWRMARERAHVRVLIHEARRVVDPQVCQTYRKLCARMSIERPPQLLFHAGVESPVLLQGDALVILIPVNPRSGQEVELALAHELAHVKHADLRWAWLHSMVDALFFFHPLVPLALKKMRFLQECAADAAAMGATHADAATYSRVLLSFADARSPKYGMAMSQNAIELKRRIEAAFHATNSSRLQWLGVAAASIFLAAALVPWQLEGPSQPDARFFAPIAARVLAR